MRAVSTKVRPMGVVPELDVAELERSVNFYAGLLGFSVVFERPTERFVYLALDTVQVMIQEAAGPGRRFRTAPLEHPYGRDINLQAQVVDIDALHNRVRSGGADLLLPLEERWYNVNVATPGGRWTQTGPTTAGNRQLVIADPDGYLWRFFSPLQA